MLTNIWGSEYKINYYGEELDFKRVKVINGSLQPQGEDVIFNVFKCGSLRTRDPRCLPGLFPEIIATVKPTGSSVGGSHENFRVVGFM